MTFIYSLFEATVDIIDTNGLFKDLEEGYSMEIKIFITVIRFVSVVLGKDSIPPWKLKSNSVCPESTKFISRDISLSSFQVSSNSPNISDNEQPLVVAPISRRTLKKFEMTVLKQTREVCILGQKVENFKLTKKYLFETRVGIAIWFYPCITKPRHDEIINCIKPKCLSYESVDVKLFKTLFEFISGAVQDI